MCGHLPRTRLAALILTALLLGGCSEGPKPTESVAPAQPPAPQAAGPSPERVYLMNCGRCHQPQGQGVPGVAPPLKDNPVVTANDPAELIRTLLYGMGGKAIDGIEYPGRMPGFSEILTDEELALVTNYLRTNWGHRASHITPADIRKERKRP